METLLWTRVSGPGIYVHIDFFFNVAFECHTSYFSTGMKSLFGVDSTFEP
jgi:hypothetical protein